MTGSTTYKIKGMMRDRANRYDYVSVMPDGPVAMICAREGGERGGYAELDADGIRKLIVALQATLAEMEGRK